MTATGPLLSRIRDDLGLSGAAVGVLTSLPVLCLGAFAFVGPVLGRRWGEAPSGARESGPAHGGAAVRQIPDPGALFAGRH
ncbi:hypothetical protein [Streptomyces sp. SID3343]|uniref:hypothetical protein n=1 Tax=Streptomyces sp. SID3343 TaxID=2690260 RepID=UPI00136B62DD|nr:hypothetical protein [Streptomyces sp. SID3343]MYW04127.1 hypothetical protein [Streptomyces sp. SID3343]